MWTISPKLGHLKNKIIYYWIIPYCKLIVKLSYSTLTIAGFEPGIF
jgi:hypothetical protein